MAATEDVVLRGRHVVPVGQQKSEGKAAPQRVSVESPPHVAVSLGVRGLLPASGSNSCGIHMTRADDRNTRKESASVGVAECIVGNITRVDESVPAECRRALRRINSQEKAVDEAVGNYER